MDVYVAQAEIFMCFFFFCHSSVHVMNQQNLFSQLLNTLRKSHINVHTYCFIQLFCLRWPCSPARSRSSTGNVEKHSRQPSQPQLALLSNCLTIHIFEAHSKLIRHPLTGIGHITFFFIIALWNKGTTTPANLLVIYFEIMHSLG